MPSVPKPVTSPPNTPFQPYDATSPGGSDAQSAPTTIYDAAGGSGAGEPWVKVQDAGHSGDFKASDGTWPGDGTSDASAWKQC